MTNWAPRSHTFVDYLDILFCKVSKSFAHFSTGFPVRTFLMSTGRAVIFPFSFMFFIPSFFSRSVLLTFYSIFKENIFVLLILSTICLFSSSLISTLSLIDWSLSNFSRSHIFNIYFLIFDFQHSFLIFFKAMDFPSSRLLGPPSIFTWQFHYHLV